MVKRELDIAIMNQENFKQKIHLFISVIIVVPVSFLYGFDFFSLFNIDINSNDELHVFKAIMGLYLGFSFLWALGLFKEKFLFTALISNVIFMLGLGFGRLLSFVIDGTPSILFIFGTFGELILGFYGLWVLYNEKK